MPKLKRDPTYYKAPDLEVGDVDDTSVALAQDAMERRHIGQRLPGYTRIGEGCYRASKREGSK